MNKAMNKYLKVALIGATVYTGLDIYGNVFFALGKGNILGVLSHYGESAEDALKILKDDKNSHHPVYTNAMILAAKATEWGLSQKKEQ